jgi:pyruvate ferredoxin oxidoreductase beta subunit
MSAEQACAFEKITPKNLPEFEALASGHRACQGCAEMLAMRLVFKAVGPDVIVVSATGCMEVVTTPYPQTAWQVPWLHTAFENASAVASGVEAARKAMFDKGRLKNNETKIVAIGGDGGTADIGFQSLSGALERGHNFTYVCFDNEAYMNTGIQRSSATPEGAWTTTTPLGEEAQNGKLGQKKDLAAIVAAHKIPYVATATPAGHIDLMNKVRRAVNTPGPAFIHVLAPCPTGWRMPTKYAVKIAKLAVDTRVFPLYEVIDGKYVLSRQAKKAKPVEEYLKMQGRFKHMSQQEIVLVQASVDQHFAELNWLASKED